MARPDGKGRFGWLAAVALLSGLAAALPALAQSVLTYHNSPDRSGRFVQPELSPERAGGMQLDPGFAPRFAGNLYAQPLYWRPPDGSAARLIVATESNTVLAIEAATGKTVWSRSLGRAAPLSAFPCGNIDPLGVTGTPVIDAATGTLYLDAMAADAPGLRHRLFALALADGSTRPGWPIDVAEALRLLGHNFDSRVQNQRGALLLSNGVVYVPYGGFFGDCGDFHGWVVGVRADNPRQVMAWRTRGRGGGIWAPGGIASDGASLFVATGNTEGASEWSDGEAVIRLAPDLRRSASSADFFAPADWHALDTRDADLGGSNPLPFDLPASGGALPLVLALGKDRNAYLLDRRNLGGIGGALVAERVSGYPIRTAPAVWPGSGGWFVALQANGRSCPSGGGDLTVLKISSGTRPQLATAWCGGVSGAGAPIVTTTDDAGANPIVWMLGAEGDNRLYGFRGDSGERLFVSPPLAGLRHFQTLIAADNRLYVGADGRLYAFGLR